MSSPAELEFRATAGTAIGGGAHCQNGNQQWPPLPVTIPALAFIPATHLYTYTNKTKLGQPLQE